MTDVVHRYNIGLIFGVVIAFAGLLVLGHPSRVNAADICYPNRSMSQWRCIPGKDARCAPNGWYSGLSGGSQPCGAYGTDAPNAFTNCVTNCQGPYGGTCTIASCLNYISGTEPTCKLEADRIVPCTSDPCQTTVAPVDCVASGVLCTETTGKPLGCWGPGPTPTPGASCGNAVCEAGENCSNCRTDCGACPALCPNGACDIAETCSTCPADCGVCPTATVNARAVTVGSSDTSCTAVAASTDYLAGTTFSLSPAVSPASQTQSDGSYVSWGSVPITNTVSGDTYTLSATPPSANSLLKNACYTKTGGAPYTQGFAATILPNQTVTWNMGYGPPGAWVQTNGGGDVYASATLQSYVPVGTTPRAFILNGTGGYPGIAVYGQSYNFDRSGVTRGQTWVSSKNWLVNNTASGIDYYQLMYQRFGGAPATVDYVNPSSPIAQPASRATPYYVTGDMTTSGDWVVGAGQNIVFLVNGNLTIAGKINITGSGFVAFIVNGNITVAPTVGVAYTSSTPVVEGIYITSLGGTFSTGASTNVGTERFVGKGMFVAGSFLLGRDVGDAGNPTTSSEIFVYNPQLLLTMPNQMKQISVSWQEVAP